MEQSMIPKLDGFIGSNRALKRQIKLEVRKGMFYNSITPFDMNPVSVMFKVEKNEKLIYMLKKDRELFSNQIMVSAYQGTAYGRYSSHSPSFVNWTKLGDHGWKKAVLLMRVWPEWSDDDDGVR